MEERSDAGRASETLLRQLLEAKRLGAPIRLHLRDGEVVIARLLWVDDGEVGYAALRSSRPERYATCDSTGVRVQLTQIQRTQLLRDPT